MQHLTSASGVAEDVLIQAGGELISAANPLNVKVVAGDAAQRQTTLWTDDSGAAFVRIDSGTAIAWTDVAGSPSPGPGAGMRPAGGTAMAMSWARHSAVNAGPSYAAGDRLDHIVTANPSTCTVLGSFWLNVSQGAKLSAAPAPADLADYAPLPAGTATDASVQALRGSLGTPGDAAATSDDGAFSALALVKRGLLNWSSLLGTLLTTAGGRAARTVLADPVSGSPALVQPFHAADGLTPSASASGLFSGSVDLLVNDTGSLDRQRAVAGDGATGKGFAAQVPMMWTGSGYDRIPGTAGSGLKVQPMIGGAPISTSNPLPIGTTDQRGSLTYDVSKPGVIISLPVTPGQTVFAFVVQRLTGSNAYVVCEGSDDGSTWQFLPFVSNTALKTDTFAITTDTQGRASASGRTAVRLRCWTAGTGTVSVAWALLYAPGAMGFAAPLPPGLNVIGSVLQRTTLAASASGVTPNASYTAGMCVGGPMGFANSTDTNTTGILRSISILFSSRQTANLKLALFYNPIGFATFSDRQVPTLTTSDMLNLLGIVTLTPDATFSNCTVYYANLQLGYAALVNQILYAILIAQGPMTFSTASDLVRVQAILAKD